MHTKYKDIGQPDDVLIEECAELIHAIAKAKRFGWDNFHPDNPTVSNAQRVLDEMEDVQIRIKELRGKINSFVK